MSQEVEWYVAQEGGQLGPYSSDQMRSFAQSGNITRESMVWAQGMAEWLTAAHIEGLFPVVTPRPVPSSARTAPAPAAARPVRPGTQVTARTGQATAAMIRPGQATATAAQIGQAPQGGFPRVQVAPASFGLIAGMFAAGILLPIIGLLLLSQSAQQIEKNPNLVFVLLGLAGLGFLCLIVAQILGLITLHRAWKCLSRAGASVTPGAAVGFLFIPFFNLYWIFRAYYGFSQEWNRLTAAYEDSRRGPRMPEGLFLTFCIANLVFPPLGMILLFPVLSSFCKAIHFMTLRWTSAPAGVRR